MTAKQQEIPKGIYFSKSFYYKKQSNQTSFINKLLLIEFL